VFSKKKVNYGEGPESAPLLKKKKKEEEGIATYCMQPGGGGKNSTRGGAIWGSRGDVEFSRQSWLHTSRGFWQRRKKTGRKTVC